MQSHVARWSSWSFDPWDIPTTGSWPLFFADWAVVFSALLVLLLGGRALLRALPSLSPTLPGRTRT
jgi:hypothetical protein